MQIAKSKGSRKLAGSCEVKHHALAAMQRVAMPGTTKSRQGQVWYPLQLTQRNNVYDKVRNIISTGSKILNRIPTGVKTEIKKLAAPLLNKALEPTKKTLEPVLENIPIKKRIINDRQSIRKSQRQIESYLK